MEEVWRPIPSIPGYSASDHGRIRLDTCMVPMPNGGERQSGGVPLRCNPDRRKAGRLRVMVRGKTRHVAPMVCEAFHGPRPFPTAHCMHLNEEATDDRPQNLAWGSAKENANTPRLKETQRSRVGEKHANCKLPSSAVVEIRAAKGSVSTLDLATRYGISRDYIYQIWSGTTRVRG